MMLRKMAAVVDKRAPTHQPIQLPTKIPMNPSSFRIHPDRSGRHTGSLAEVPAACRVGSTLPANATLC
jgi:hypothetical protein